MSIVGDFFDERIDLLSKILGSIESGIGFVDDRFSFGSGMNLKHVE